MYLFNGIHHFIKSRVYVIFNILKVSNISFVYDLKRGFFIGMEKLNSQRKML
jgi:hypothetical protein